jgi:adenylate kinase
LLDGFPRTLRQGEALDEALAKEGQRVDKAVYLKVSEGELLRRLSGRWLCRTCGAPYHTVTAPPRLAGKCDRCGGELYQRPDDTEATARNRLKVYFESTVPLIAYYRDRGNLVEVDGEQAVAAVRNALMNVLGAGTEH